jgi:hypothetical protein
LDTSIEGFTTTSAEDVSSDLASLRVTGEDELRIGAPLGIGRHLDVAGNGAIVGGLAGEVGVECRVDEVFVAAAGHTITGRRHELALSTRVRLIVTTREKEMNVVAFHACLCCDDASEREDGNGYQGKHDVRIKTPANYEQKSMDDTMKKMRSQTREKLQNIDESGD